MHTLCCCLRSCRPGKASGCTRQKNGKLGTSDLWFSPFNGDPGPRGSLCAFLVKKPQILSVFKIKSECAAFLWIDGSFSVRITPPGKLRWGWCWKKRARLLPKPREKRLLFSVLLQPARDMLCISRSTSVREKSRKEPGNGFRKALAKHGLPSSSVWARACSSRQLEPNQGHARGHSRGSRLPRAAPCWWSRGLPDGFSLPGCCRGEKRNGGVLENQCHDSVHALARRTQENC